jgi:hypothetical protein
MAKKPTRACVLTMRLGADRRQDIVDELRQLAEQLEQGKILVGVLASPSIGGAYEYLESDRPTHQEYFAELNAYLEGLKS